VRAIILLRKREYEIRSVHSLDTLARCNSYAIDYLAWSREGDFAMNIAQAIELALAEVTEIPSSAEISKRADEIMTAHNQLIAQSKGYDTLSVKRVKTHLDPLFKEQNYTISKLATSTASEFLSEGRDVWRLCKNNTERNIATIVYNEIRERITRGFK
jgi:hypothetical protein